MYKKIIIAFFLLIPFLITGCINSSKNNYNSVDEYEKAMTVVQGNHAGYFSALRACYLYLFAIRNSLRSFRCKRTHEMIFCNTWFYYFGQCK